MGEKEETESEAKEKPTGLEERKTEKKIVKWNSRSTVSKIKDKKPTVKKIEISEVVNNGSEASSPKKSAKDTLKMLSSCEPISRDPKAAIEKNKTTFKSIQSVSVINSVGPDQTQWSLVENFHNPLRDLFLEDELKMHRKEDLDKMYDRYWYDYEISQVKIYKVIFRFLRIWWNK